MELDLQRFYNVNRRILMWIVFFGIVYLLRDFFAVMFLAFIMGFVMRKVAKFMVITTRAPYWAAVVFPYLAALTLLVLLMVTAIPTVIKEGVHFSKQVPSLLNTVAEEVKKSAVRYHMEPLLIRYAAPDRLREDEADVTYPTTQEVFESISTKELLQPISDFIARFAPSASESDEHTAATPERPTALKDLFFRFVVGISSGTIKFLLAILLSFLIVLDFDKLMAELRSWRDSPVGKFFHEAAESVVEFSHVVGTAFQCQLVVALLNATITCIGLAILDIQPLLLLTSIVFLLGLIPVLGVWISSIPIVLIAFNDHGIARAGGAIGLITGVHLLEAYVFNPRIYAARFHLNPVIVLIILLVGEKLFGVWGMLLGIPVTHYVLNVAQMPSLPVKGRPRPLPSAAATKPPSPAR